MEGGCGLADPDRGEVNVLCDWRQVFFPPAGSPDGPGIFYSFDWGPAHFAAFDTNSHALAGGDQLRWLEADLEAARAGGARWLILYFHEPVITVGSYSEPSQFAQLKAPIVIPPIADRFDVDLVLSGHEHNYQRSHPVRGGVVRDAWQDPAFVSPRGTIYLVTGGGGRQLYPEILESDHRFTRHRLFAHHALELVITPYRLTVRALSPAKEVLDELSSTKEGTRPELRFIRGDANADGAVNLADAVRVLDHLFLGTALECPFFSDTVADADGSGTVGINDPIFLLNHLFLGGPAPRGPFPECGTTPEADDAWCTRSGCAR